MQDLPEEVVTKIADSLDCNSDLGSLRLVCKSIHAAVQLAAADLTPRDKPGMDGYQLLKTCELFLEASSLSLGPRQEPGQRTCQETQAIIEEQRSMEFKSRMHVLPQVIEMLTKLSKLSMVGCILLDEITTAAVVIALSKHTSFRVLDLGKNDKLAFLPEEIGLLIFLEKVASSLVPKSILEPYLFKPLEGHEVGSSQQPS